MKITKFVHSCLLVEMPEPTARTVLFDPGVMSSDMLRDHHFEYLDDIVITHEHSDHFDPEIIKMLVDMFPKVRILGPQPVVDRLSDKGVAATTNPPEGMRLFDAPHENVQPMFPQPAEIGVHYLDKISHPGDSHSFNETMPILALPVTAPWGHTVRAINLAIELKPKYVLPIHDWFWHEQAKQAGYGTMSQVLDKEGITFIKLTDGEPVVLDV